MPERSFFFKGYQFPVCARCTGVLIGEIGGLFLSFFKLLPHVLICIAMTFPLILDGTMQYLQAIKSNNTRRLITGILFGIGLMGTLCNILRRVIALIKNKDVEF